MDEQSAGFGRRQPITQPHAELFDALHPTDAGNSGLNNPASAASYAIRRTAANLTLMVPDASLRDSRCIRYRRTTVRLKDNLGSEQYQSMNSSIACR